MTVRCDDEDRLQTPVLSLEARCPGSTGWVDHPETDDVHLIFARTIQAFLFFCTRLEGERQGIGSRRLMESTSIQDGYGCSSR